MSSTETETSESYWQPGTGGHIAVGVDQSHSSRVALAWAADEARTRDVPLHVIFAWSGIGVDIARASGWVQAVTTDLEKRAAEEIIHNAVREVLGDDPDVKLIAVPMPGEGAQALIEASKDADMLVVGSRGEGGFDGLHLGSVSEKCVHHAYCPVVVIRTGGD